MNVRTNAITTAIGALYDCQAMRQPSRLANLAVGRSAACENALSDSFRRRCRTAKPAAPAAPVFALISRSLNCWRTEGRCRMASRMSSTITAHGCVAPTTRRHAVQRSAERSANARIATFTSGAPDLAASFARATMPANALGHGAVCRRCPSPHRRRDARRNALASSPARRCRAQRPALLAQLHAADF